MKIESILKQLMRNEPVRQRSEVMAVIEKDVGSEIMIMPNSCMGYIIPDFQYKFFARRIGFDFENLGIKRLPDDEIKEIIASMEFGKYVCAEKSGIMLGDGINTNGKFERILIELVGNNGETSVWIDEKFLKYFEKPRFLVPPESQRKPVLIKENKRIVGFILPVEISLNRGIDILEAGMRNIAKEKENDGE